MTRHLLSFEMSPKSKVQSPTSVFKDFGHWTLDLGRFVGARGETRTHEYRGCNPAPWPLGDARKLERKERFELSNRVWKTRMFPATSLPRVIAAHRQLESAIGNVGTPGRIRTR